MQSPFKRLKSSTFSGSKLIPLLVSILLLGNLLLAPSFAWSSTLSAETAHAANRSNSTPLDPTIAAIATTTIAFAASITPTPTLTPQPTVIATPLPDVGINQTNGGINVFQAGQTITYSFNVTSTPLSGQIGTSQPVMFKAMLPIGLQNVVATGSSWIITISSASSPTMIAAIYRGTYPIVPGTTIQPIVITGTISTAVIQQITCMATVGVSGDGNPDNNMANNTIYIRPALSTSTRHLMIKHLK